MKTIGLFSGCGGFEVAAKSMGHTIEAVAEIDPYACAVLAHRFPDVPNLGDVTRQNEFTDADLITAGFPCQDLSIAGKQAGIHGARTGTVRHVFHAIRNSTRKPEFLLFENVPQLLSLHGGAGINWLIEQVEALGYRWAYRRIDSEAFGLAQRRRRVFFLASLSHDPARMLLDGDVKRKLGPARPDAPCGFYWTEGKTGIGWAIDAVPPLRSMSDAAIMSCPAIWRPEEGDFVIPGIEDAEALQGFERGWTVASTPLPKGERLRWRLVGNAVSVPAINWILAGLTATGRRAPIGIEVTRESGNKAKACFGANGRRYAVDVGDFPVEMPNPGVMSFVRSPSPLSHRQMAGFLHRYRLGNLRANKSDAFERDLVAMISSTAPARPKSARKGTPVKNEAPLTI